jgi:hypothetical protein
VIGGCVNALVDEGCLRPCDMMDKRCEIPQRRVAGLWEALWDLHRLYVRQVADIDAPFSELFFTIFWR